jgi:hypothetical protein
MGAQIGHSPYGENMDSGNVILAFGVLLCVIIKLFQHFDLRYCRHLQSEYEMTACTPNGGTVSTHDADKLKNPKYTLDNKSR